MGYLMKDVRDSPKLYYITTEEEIDVEKIE
jgi:hypothetical protein